MSGEYLQRSNWLIHDTGALQWRTLRDPSDIAGIPQPRAVVDKYRFSIVLRYIDTSQHL
jgi:hypothetical protein